MPGPWEQYAAQPATEQGPWSQYAAAGQSEGIPTGTMSAVPNQSFSDKATLWAQNVAADLKNGTDLTGVGSVLKKMGAHGLNYGNSEGVGEFMGSLPLGLAKMVQGAGETGQGHPLQGGKDVVSGAAQAATIPGSFVAPEVAEPVANAAGKIASGIASKVTPSGMAQSAGNLLQTVAKDANKVPVSLDNSSAAAARLMDWQGKTQLGPTINKFLNRITNPKMAPLNYADGRDFYQLLGRLSADEASKLPPAVRRDLTQMVIGLKDDLGNAADQVGQAANYAKGMKDYATAMRLQGWVDFAKNALAREGLKGVAKGAGIGAGGAIGYQVYQQSQK